MLYISYVGQSIIDNEPGPPSSLVSELTNYLTTRYDLSDRKRPLTERHPLQAYSRDYFTGGALHSWSPENFRTARRLMERNEIAPPPFLATPLQPPPEEPGDSPETLPDPTTLYTFFRHPFRWFCRRTLRLQDQFETAELPEDTEKLSPDPLQYSQLRSTLLRLELSGLPRTDWVECRRADGSLPPAPFDRLVLESLERECSELLDLPKKEFGGSTVRQLFLSEKRLELPPELQFSEILAAARHDDCTALLLPGKWNGRMAILGILFRLLAGLRRMAEAPGMPLEGVILVCADRIARFSGENSPVLNGCGFLTDKTAAALFSDGTLYIAPADNADNASGIKCIRLPSLNGGYIYTSFIISGEKILAGWEERRFYETGRSGILEVTLNPEYL